MPLSPPTGTITFLFTDIEGSTHLWEKHPDAMKIALERHDAILREAVQAQQGYIFKTMGDAFCVAFQTPLNALLTALSAQRALQNEAWGAEIGMLRVRMGLHTGTAQEREQDYLGPTVNRVARLMGAGHGGQVLLSLATQELVRDDLPAPMTLVDLGQHHLKDLFRPEQIFQLNTPDLPCEFPALRTLELNLTNLPVQSTPFVGRERELVSVLGLLREANVRLVTLSGVGGTGKTRLSLQVAADLLDEYPDGVFFIDLAPITDATLFAKTVAKYLGVGEIGNTPLLETLKSHLQDKQLLLILDNFEQIIPATPMVAELLAGAPKIKLIVTSREALQIYGEHEYAVPPLSLPNLKSKETTAVLSQYEAVALFILRAKGVKHDFEINDENAPAVAEICVRLDGLPLAIELAAARIKVFTPQVLLTRLENRLKTLTSKMQGLPLRQQTLRAAIDWSYNLLEPAEQKLFGRLGVFTGGRSFAAIEAICGTDLELDLWEGVESLLNKSLLRRSDDANNEPRFVMLETIHEYAREQLAQQPDAEQIHRRHLDYFLQLAEQAEQFFRGPDEVIWMYRLNTELDNLRTAFAWAVHSHQPELGARLTCALQLFWQRFWHYSEGEKWNTTALSFLDELPPDLQASLLWHASAHAFYQSDPQNGVIWGEQAVAIARKNGNKTQLAWALIHLAINLNEEVTKYAEAMACCQEGLTLFREVNELKGVAQTLNMMGELARTHGDYAQAQLFYQECIAQSEQTGEKVRVAMNYNNLSAVAYVTAEYRQSLDYAQKALNQWLALGNYMGVMYNLYTFVGPIAALGNNEKAIKILGACESFIESNDFNLQSVDQIEFDRHRNHLQTVVDAATFATLLAEGRKLSIEQVIDYIHAS